MDRSPVARKSQELEDYIFYLRTGRVRLTSSPDAERKFNPHHDPKDGRFTLGPAGGASTRSPNGEQGTARTRQTTAADPRQAKPNRVSVEQISSIMPASGHGAGVYTDALNAAMDAHGITLPSQRAAFLAHIAVESGDLRRTTEGLNYSAERAAQVFPRKFHDASAAQPYAHKPEALANHVYAGKNGNGNEASGDGWRFRGRGLIQVTGRDNYRSVGHENDPDALAEPKAAVESAAMWWTKQGLNDRTAKLLNRAEFQAVARTINGGLTGFEKRWQAYQRATEALKARP